MMGQEATLMTSNSQQLHVGTYTIMSYSSMPYAGMTPEKMAATIKMHKGRAQNVCIRFVKSLHEPYQALYDTM